MNRPDLVPNLSNQESGTSTPIDYKGWRNRFILIILRIASALGIVLILLSYPGSSPGSRVLFISLYVLLLLVTLLPAPYGFRAFMLLAINYAVGLNALIEWGPYIDGTLFLFASVVLAGILLDNRADVIALILGMLTILIVAFLDQTGILIPLSTLAPVQTLTGWGIYLADFSILGVATVVALELFKDECARVIDQMRNAYHRLLSDHEQLEDGIQRRTEKLDERTSQLKSIKKISSSIVETGNIAELLETVANSTAEQLGYYHVGIYLMDDKRKNAFLQAASSMAGKQLIGQGFSIELNKQNPISIAAQQKKASIDPGTTGGVFSQDPNFPLTRSRLVAPLSVRGEVVGVLDLHSDKPQAFHPEDPDIDIIQSLADLVALSFDNARLSEETKSLMSQLASYTSSSTSDAWSKFTSRRYAAYQYTPAGVRPLFSPTTLDGTDDQLQIPLVLKGQKIGNVKLSRKGADVGWSDKEIELVEKIANQVALALENGRLVEEAQKSAQRDQLIANISSRVRETLDVESVIRTATMELRRVFDLKEAEISVGLPKAEPMRARKTTSSLRLG